MEQLEQTQLYGGKVKIEFNPVKHRFVVYVNGEKKSLVPTVTRITGIIDKSKVLMGWAIRNTVDVFDQCIKPGTIYSEDELNKVKALARSRTRTIVKEAADLGTLAHQWLKLYFSGKNPPMPPEDALYRPCVEAALKWVQEHKVRLLDTERPVYSVRYNICGIMDGEAELDGSLTLLDFKTGNGIYAEAQLQVSAYTHLREEEGDRCYSNSAIIRIGKNGDFHQHIYTANEQQKDWEAFLAAHTLYNRVQEIEKIKQAERLAQLECWIQTL